MSVVASGVTVGLSVHPGVVCAPGVVETSVVFVSVSGASVVVHVSVMLVSASSVWCRWSVEEVVCVMVRF